MHPLLKEYKEIKRHYPIDYTGRDLQVELSKMVYNFLKSTTIREFTKPEMVANLKNTFARQGEDTSADLYYDMAMYSLKTFSNRGIVDNDDLWFITGLFSEILTVVNDKAVNSIYKDNNSKGYIYPVLEDYRHLEKDNRSILLPHIESRLKSYLRDEMKGKFKTGGKSALDRDLLYAQLNSIVLYLFHAISDVYLY